jgi:hypothetical protein
MSRLRLAAQQFLGMHAYFHFMSMLLGGVHLAIDTTVDECVRGSLNLLAIVCTIVKQSSANAATFLRNTSL